MYSDVANGELYETLKRWRDMIVEENSIPIFMVASHASLKEIAEYLPLTKKDLMKIGGFGKAKADKYGDDILETVQDYCARHELGSNISAKESSPKKERKEKSLEEKTPTNIFSFNLFKEGKSVAEIAKERNLAITTVEGHLSWFVGNGDVDINELVSSEKQLLIKEAISINGRSSTKTLKDHLPEDVSYGEIRMVMALEQDGAKP